MNNTNANTYSGRLNTFVFICSFLSSLVPRYISTFKIHIGINISLYTIAVVITYFVFVRRFVFYKRIQSIFIVFWFIYVLLSIWRSEQLGEWAYYIDWTLTSVLFAQVLYCSDKKEVFNSLVKGLLCGLIIHLIIGYVELIRHDYFFAVSIENRRYYGEVPVSIFHNPNDYATFLVTLFPFVIYYMAKQKNIILKSLYMSVVVFAIYMIVRSKSRSAFFALLLLGLTLLWLVFKKSSINKLLIIFGMIALIGIVIVVPQIRNSVFSVLYINRMDVESIDLVRWNLIKNGFYFLKQTYGAGVGAGNLRKWLTERVIYNVGGITFMHNWYIELLSTFGVVFFSLYMFFHSKIIVTLFKSYDKKKAFWNFDNTLLVSFIGFSIVSIASSSNIYSEWVWMYLVFAGTYTMFREIDAVKCDIPT